MPLDRTISNLGVSVFFFFLFLFFFYVSLQTKSCTVKEQGRRVLWRLIRVYTVCQSPQKMPVDRSIGQNHLKIKGCQVCFICCKFTEVPVLWQIVLTLNRRSVLRPSDLDLRS